MSNTKVIPLDTESTRVDPGQVHTVRNVWEIIDSTLSGATATDLAATERTYQLVKAAIAAAANNDDEISIFDIPRSWNKIRFRAIGITDNATVTYQIYFGTLGDGNRDIDNTVEDCDLAYAGQLTFTIGQQSSIYSQVAFTSGGTRTPVVGETVVGATSGKTAVIISISVSSGAFADGDAAGTLLVRTQNGTFQSENLNLTALNGDTLSDVMTIGGDMSRFELADTIVPTTSDWINPWGSRSPISDRVAETDIDLSGADVVIAVPTTVTADCKLLVKAF